MTAKDQRTYDIVLFGATGFTGELTAKYLAEHAPADCRWALAGRNNAKLEAVRTKLAGINPKLKDLALLHADAADPASLDAVAAATKVVITTVGPYIQHGADLVRACAEAGTDYVDLTGEPEFVDTMYVENHEKAVASGARIVHACGFDSIPHDLGAYFTVKQLPGKEPITMRGVVRAGGRPSGGTVHSAITAFSRAKQMGQASKARRQAEERPEGRSSKAAGGKPRRDSALDLWLLPLPTIDPFVVARSGAALAAYGPKFRYSHFAGVRHLPVVVGTVAGVAGLMVAAQVGPVRRLLLSQVKQGEGPSEQIREKSWFTVDFIATEGAQTVHTQVAGGDPGYDETAKMLAESALCLAFDDNPTTAGQVTTAQAMGDALLARLQKAGMTFRLV